MARRELVTDRRNALTQSTVLAHSTAMEEVWAYTRLTI